MGKVLKYAIVELLRNRWIYLYGLLMFLIPYGFLYLGGEHVRAQASMMNVVILMVPLVSIVFSLMYMYQVLDYAELLLAQPISRKSIFLGYYLGLSIVLASVVIIPLWVAVTLSYVTAADVFAWVIISIIALLLTFIFCGFSCYLTLRFENRLVGFGAGLFIWLFLALVYDGVFLVLLLMFEEFPLENFALIGSLLNPIDLGRILIVFQLDFGALMGYTGAVFKKFFGSGLGSVLIGLSFMIWLAVPFLLLLRIIRKKDF